MKWKLTYFYKCQTTVPSKPSNSANTCGRMAGKRCPTTCFPTGCATTTTCSKATDHRCHRPSSASSPFSEYTRRRETFGPTLSALSLSSASPSTSLLAPKLKSSCKRKSFSGPSSSVPSLASCAQLYFTHSTVTLQPFQFFSTSNSATPGLLCFWNLRYETSFLSKRPRIIN